MTQLNQKVLILFYIKNSLATFYVVPIWFIAVALFERLSAEKYSALPLEQIILLLYGAGIIFFIGLLVSCYYWAWLSYANYSYELQNDGLHIQRGVLIRRHLIIPYNHIETIQVYVNPIVMKLLGLYSLHIKTRELTNTEGLFKKSQSELIPGLTPDTAQLLRNELVKVSHIQPSKKTFFDPISGRYT